MVACKLAWPVTSDVGRDRLSSIGSNDVSSVLLQMIIVFPHSSVSAIESSLFRSRQVMPDHNWPEFPAGSQAQISTLVGKNLIPIF
jgi:hypothetical protein